MQDSWSSSKICWTTRGHISSVSGSAILMPVQAHSNFGPTDNKALLNEDERERKQEQKCPGG